MSEQRVLGPPTVVPSVAFADVAAERTADRLIDAIVQRGVAFFALAGGQTPRGCYERLAAPPHLAGVHWAKVHFFWSDERRVPLADEQSNYRMAKEAFLDRLPIEAYQVHPMPVQDSDGDRAAEQYAGEIRALLGASSPTFDVIHLGLGEDGHTASLFPGSRALDERRRLVLAVRGDKPPPERLTFTLPLLNRARYILYMVQGEGKRAALRRLVAGEPIPAARVHPSSGTLELLADPAAWPDPA